MRKNHQKRIKSKSKEFSCSFGVDVESISAINIALSMKKRKAKGEMLNVALQCTSMNQLYSRVPLLKKPKTSDTIDQLLEDIEGIEREGKQHNILIYNIQYANIFCQIL